MRTEQLIHAMAADTTRTRLLERSLAVAVTVGVIAAVLAFLLALGVRADLAAALQALPVLTKQVLPWLFAAGATGAALRLARPGSRVGPFWALLAAVPLLIVLAMAAEAIRLPEGRWLEALIGTNLVACLVSIPLLSLPIAGSALWVLRDGASTRPRLTGLAAGLASGAAAAGIYAFHCTDDSPLFFGTWYVLAVLVVAAIAAAIAPRILRW